MAAFFIAAGCLHLLIPAFYLRMMPPGIPYPATLIVASGLVEIALGSAALLPAGRSIARPGLLFLLAAVFPANIYMALNPQLFPEFSSAALWLRLPLQPLIAVWVMYSLPRMISRQI